MADEGFIRELTGAIRGRIKDAGERTRADNRDAEIIKTEAPKQWVELKLWLQESIKQINHELNSESIIYIEENLNEVVVRYVEGQETREVTVAFTGRTSQIIAKGMLFPGAPDFESAFVPKVEGGSMHYIQDKLPNARTSVEAIGKEILNRAAMP